MKTKLISLCLVALAAFTFLHAGAAQADDTEIYRTLVEPSEGRPKVLIVFDDSGSMSGVIDQQRPPYTPNPLFAYDVKVPSGRIYWSTDGTVPDINTGNWFDVSQNRCASSYETLEDFGVFNTKGARRWVDSQVIPGDCIDTCPDDLSLRVEGGVEGCYREEPVEVTIPPVCTDNWVEVGFNSVFDGFNPPDEWLATEPSLRRTRRVFFRLFFSYQINMPNCTDERTVTELQWVLDDRSPVLVCEDDSVVDGSWVALTSDVTTPPHVDCRVDAEGSGNDGNGPGVPVGFPQNNVVSGSEFGPIADDSDAFWGGESYGFYTSDYMNYFYDASLEESREKIAIARDVIGAIISTNPGIDFGLMEFNQGFQFDSSGNAVNGRDGGRVVQRIISGMTEAQRTALVADVNGLTANGSTPLCESFYEAYRYIAGEDVLYGDNAGSTDYDPLAKDADAQSGNTYISPNTDCAFTYIILMTDGLPQLDVDANTRIETLTGKTCSTYATDDPNVGGTSPQKNCMPELAEYMATTDLDADESNNEQYGITYTIGFATDQQLLEDTAAMGKGQYYTANNTQQLIEAFQGAINDIADDVTTFTSPAVAVDTFTRTQSRDDVFYAMFLPSVGIDWPGNIKKLRVQESNGSAVLVDANGVPAIDDSTGFIRTDATTFWSSAADGGAVEEGGVGGRLSLSDPAARNIYIDTGANQSLEPFTLANLDAAAFGVGSDAALWSLFGTSTQAGFELQVAWGRGADAYDENGDSNTTEARRWILGDILHSQPLVLNYGARPGFSVEDPDLRFVVGTNAGFVHMFGNTDGDEDWAFIPKELVSLLAQRRRNPTRDDNVYGMDLTASSYRVDVDQDGTIEPGDGDKVYIYFGMRRGGNSYYAFDVTNPDTPVLMWSIGPADIEFKQLGQTWSQPTPTFVPGYVDNNGDPKPVVVFGAGYDTSKDSTGIALSDTVGRGVYIVDAVTGALVWSVTPDANSSENLQEADLLHSVAADVTVVDGNGDGISDRIYFGDTGGDVWRIDMPGNELPVMPASVPPNPDDAAWYIVKVASINEGTAAADRRIHNAIDVVRTRFNGQAFDALIFATGDRTNPNAIDVGNRLYMVRDEGVSAYTTPAPTAAECGAEDFSGDFRCSLPISNGSLFDITDNSLASEDDATVISTLSGGMGWRMDLQGLGEKGLARPLTLDGQIFVTTYTPNDLLANISICGLAPGLGRLYVVSLFDGDRTLLNLAPVIPDTPSVYFGEDGRVRLLLPPGTPPQGDIGNGELNCSGGVCEVGQLFRSPYSNYWLQEEF